MIDGGAEPVSGLILPTSKFFPDHFDRTEKAIKRLMRRVVKLAGLSDIDITPKVVSSSEAAAGGGCSSGACAIPSGKPTRVQRVEEKGDGYVINLMASEVGNATVLTTGMIRAVSHIFIREADVSSAFDRRDAELGIDLVGVFLGFGTLLANGAYMYQKG